jgi:hypothetical protein
MISETVGRESTFQAVFRVERFASIQGDRDWISSVSLYGLSLMRVADRVAAPPLNNP